jgi:hypothetical protein
MEQGTNEGGCSCGAIRYRIAAGPVLSATCECRSCRRASAAAIVPWIHIDTARMTIVQGEPVTYVSSPGVTRTFCGRCGTPLTYHKASYGQAIDVTTCSLDDPNAFPPMVHLWTSHRLAWVQLAAGIPCLPEGPPDA